MSDPDTSTEHHHHVLTYIVNNEAEQTHATELPVAVILEQAGYPPADYRLISENPRHEYSSTDAVELHEGQRFEALHRGPTQTS